MKVLFTSHDNTKLELFHLIKKYIGIKNYFNLSVHALIMPIHIAKQKYVLKFKRFLDAIYRQRIPDNPGITLQTIALYPNGLHYPKNGWVCVHVSVCMYYIYDNKI